MGVTTVTLNLNVPVEGQPTKNTPDAYSLVDTTEKEVDVHVVDFRLPMSQRITDSRLTSVIHEMLLNRRETKWRLKMNLANDQISTYRT